MLEFIRFNGNLRLFEAILNVFSKEGGAVVGAASNFLDFASKISDFASKILKTTTATTTTTRCEFAAALVVRMEKLLKYMEIDQNPRFSKQNPRCSKQNPGFSKQNAQNRTPELRNPSKIH